MIESPKPIEDVDFFTIKRIKYRLLISSYITVEKDEEFDDWMDIINPAGTKDKTGSIDDILVISKTIVRSEDRRIDDPTKPFDLADWLREKHNLGANGRPLTEKTIGDF